MSWVKRRNTRYEEDLAYCLLGMCDVFLPLIYGEGKQNAFGRLRKEAEHHEREILIQDLTNQLELHHQVVLCVTGGLK